MDRCRILIVEDESLVAMDMADMLTRLGYEPLPGAMDYSEAIKQLDEKHTDLVLVDITLRGTETGIDLARLIRDQYRLPFIFITSHSDKEIVGKAVATQPNGYLMKPFDANDLFTSIEVALANYSGKTGGLNASNEGFLINDSIFVKTDKCFTRVKISDIHWLEAEHNYMSIVSEKGKHMVRSSFKEFLESIPQERFVQVHKSYIVNLDKIDSFSYAEIMIAGKEIPLSRLYKDSFFNRMNKVQ